MSALNRIRHPYHPQPDLPGPASAPTWRGHFVDYTPSPEVRYPIAIEQAYAATKWVVEHGDEINVDGSRIAVAGDSVGGNMTAAVTLMAKRRGGPALREQMLFYPVTDANFSTGSYREFADGPWLTRRAMKWFWDAYAPNAKDRKRILASPLRASLNQLKDLPKALVITDEADVLRDEGEAYAAKLRATGNDITTVRHPGIIHDFAMLNALANTNAAKAAVHQANRFLTAAPDPHFRAARLRPGRPRCAYPNISGGRTPRTPPACGQDRRVLPMTWLVAVLAGLGSGAGAVSS
ncbi:alpha/beta hydrolase [Streptomyces sp. NPDC086549]|uniref:alpha/beta hydrolase n=1 Tax=Streptomyces sp. NPDC086549 TaxID=3365752 RepID=UPI0037F72E9A